MPDVPKFRFGPVRHERHRDKENREHGRRPELQRVDAGALERRRFRRSGLGPGRANIAARRR